MKKERKEYEQKYLARYKEPKAKPKKPSNLKSDVDLVKLNLRKHTVTKRREYLAERKEYEKNISLDIINNKKQSQRKKQQVLIYTNPKNQNQNET